MTVTKTIRDALSMGRKAQAERLKKARDRANNERRAEENINVVRGIRCSFLRAHLRGKTRLTRREVGEMYAWLRKYGGAYSDTEIPGLPGFRYQRLNTGTETPRFLLSGPGWSAMCYRRTLYSDNFGEYHAWSFSTEKIP